MPSCRASTLSTLRKTGLCQRAMFSKANHRLRVIASLNRSIRKNAPWNLARVSTRNRLSDQNSLGLSYTYEYDSKPGDGVDIYVVDTGLFLFLPRSRRKGILDPPSTGIYIQHVCELCLIGFWCANFLLARFREPCCLGRCFLPWMQRRSLFLSPERSYSSENRKRMATVTAHT